jgi:hemerythrin
MGKYVEWEDKYSVGVKQIDEQHKKLLDFTNELYDACGAGRDEADKLFKQTIKKSVDYVKVHFKDEEELMLANNYSEYPSHKKKHEEFIMQILEDVKNYETGRKFVPNNFVRFLRDWLLEHIAITDKKLQKYLNDRGVY